MVNQNIPCPCCSGKNYAECCQPFHEGLQPVHAVELMRSRYSAYALGLADYIIDTTAPFNPMYSSKKARWRKEIASFFKETKFRKLDILSFEEDEERATVVFTAYITQKGKDATFTEQSLFQKIDSRWLYTSGKVFPGALV
jgi:SEC-C motif domain protein